MPIYFNCGKEHGLEGSCTDELVEKLGASECDSVAFRVDSNVDIKAGGIRKAGSEWSAIELTKKLDAMTPALLINCALGMTIKKVQIDFAASSGSNVRASSSAYLTYELKNVVIRHYSTTSDGGMPSEIFSLLYEEFTIIYRIPPKTSKNKDGSPVVQNWSVIQNAKL